MKPFKTFTATAVASMLLSVAGASYAAVSADEAAKLKTELTPLGGERAGNKDGSIPAWTGVPAPYGQYKAGGRRPDPFASDKPLYTVTSKNMAQYADKLSDGVKAMLTKYPDSFRLDVYPTRRTAAAPQWVYDNTLKNATRAKLEGEKVVGAYGGVPFPIPKTGTEVMWNHQLRWRGASIDSDMRAYLNTAVGQRVLVGESSYTEQYPYFMKDGNADEFQKVGDYWMLRILTSGPPIRAGEGIAGRQNVDPDKDQVWVYLAGQRRVRKLPNACCDAPSPPTAGLMTFDETYVYGGRMDRFDWKIVGKREMLVPYNTNGLLTAEKDEDLFLSKHMNPDRVRWELHRVWVVDAELRAGQRHATPKSRYYVDEDSWFALLGDRWDARGQLWKTMWHPPFAAPDMPGLGGTMFGYYDLLSGAWFVQGVTAQQAKQYQLTGRLKETMFSPEAMAGEGVR